MTTIGVLRRAVPALVACAALLSLGQGSAVASAPARASASVPGAAAAVPAGFPSWLVPTMVTDEVDFSVWHGCTAIAITPSRVITGADCYGPSQQGTWWSYDPHTQVPTSGGGGNLLRRVAPQYNAATRQDDLSVRIDLRINQHTGATAVLAGPADAALYRAGAAAVFYSWSGTGANWRSVRTPHSEPALIRSAADCAGLVGHALPAGMFCTSPAPGPTVGDSARCLGDDGGALVAGGKLIGVGATPAAGCSVNGVRLYTSVAARHQLIQSWGRDVYANSGLDGAVSAVTPEGNLFSACGDWMKFCTAGGSGQALAMNAFNLVLQPGDLNGDGWGDLIMRSNAGRLWADLGYHDDVHQDFSKDAKVYLGAGWNGYTSILAPGDFNGDGLPDLLARDARGNLWLYPGNGRGGVGGRSWISGGWNTYNLLAAHGDFSGDGVADLLVRDAHGLLWRYTNNGRGGFTAHRTPLGGGWGAYSSIVVVGDQDGKGHNQVIGRLPNGQIYRWTDNGRGGLGPRVALGGNSELRTARLS